jgi:hypothetical protein
MLAIWIAVVEMRLLGLYYFRHQEHLKWNRSDPRWGVRWRF